MQPQELLNQYLAGQHMMQLATAVGDKPWCCTVYYVHDAERNLYWASLPTRRHSQEIAQNNKVAVTIPVKFVNGEKVVGIQAEGIAEELEPSKLDRAIVQDYATKFMREEQWIEDFMTGKTAHRLYRLTPASIVLFDEANFPDNPQQAI